MIDRYGEIYSFDPGKATGIAEVGTDAGDPWFAQILPEDEAMDYLLDVALTHVRGMTLVVCESIVITAGTAKKSSDVHASLRQIGTIHHACRRANVDLLMQQPNEGMKFGLDKLRACGWWTKGPDHANSASAHLLLACSAVVPGFKELVMARLKEPSDVPVGLPG